MPLVHEVLPPRVPADRPPLLVLLHGIGADEHDLLPLAAHLDPRLLVVSARAPHPEPPGWRWYEIDWSTRPPRADPAEIAASRDLLATFVEEIVAKHGADRTRAYLLGFSQGAIVSLALLLARPDLVRGVVAHSGRLVRLPGAQPNPDALSRAHVLVLHGEDDAVVPADQGRRACEVLATLVGPRATLRLFPGLGHGISQESLAEAARWLAARLDEDG